MENLIIIGTGCAGYTAGIYAGRADLNPLILAGAQPGGQLSTTTEVENFPGFPKGIRGPELMMGMMEQAQRFGARIQYDAATSIMKRSDGGFEVWAGERKHEARAVIIATGASARHLGLPNEKELIGRGLTSCATCDGAFYRNVPVCVVGGGDSAVEEANFLTGFTGKPLPQPVKDAPPHSTPKDIWQRWITIEQCQLELCCCRTAKISLFPEDPTLKRP